MISDFDTDPIQSDTFTDTNTDTNIDIPTIARSGQLAGYIVPKSVIKWGEPNYRSEPTVTVRCVGLSLLVDSNHLLLKKEKQVFHSVTVRCEWQ